MILRFLSRFRRCTGIGGQCLYRVNHTGPCYNGKCLVFPGPPARLTPMEELMHGEGPCTGQPLSGVNVLPSHEVQPEQVPLPAFSSVRPLTTEVQQLRAALYVITEMAERSDAHPELDIARVARDALGLSDD